MDEVACRRVVVSVSCTQGAWHLCTGQRPKPGASRASSGSCLPGSRPAANAGTAACPVRRTGTGTGGDRRAGARPPDRRHRISPLAAPIPVPVGGPLLPRPRVVPATGCTAVTSGEEARRCPPQDHLAATAGRTGADRPRATEPRHGGRRHDVIVAGRSRSTGGPPSAARRVNTMVKPPPGVSSAASTPPIASTKPRATARPRPTPAPPGASP